MYSYEDRMRAVEFYIAVSNLGGSVSDCRCKRNPPIKEELRLRGFERDIPAGFLVYPVNQAADITAFQATVVPVGNDQLSMIEQTNELVRSFNASVGAEVLVECSAVKRALGLAYFP